MLNIYKLVFFYKGAGENTLMEVALLNLFMKRERLYLSPNVKAFPPLIIGYIWFTFDKVNLIMIQLLIKQFYSLERQLVLDFRPKEARFMDSDITV